MRRTLKKAAGLLLAGVLFGVGIAGCGTGAANGADVSENEPEVSGAAATEEVSETSGDTAGLKTVTIGGISQGDYLSGFVGITQQLGYFEEELNAVGYTAEFSGFQSGPAVNEAFASGAVDVAFMGDLPAITAKGGGLDSKVIVTTGGAIKYSILAHDDFEFTSFQDFEGKKIASATGTVIQYFIESYLTDNGVDISKVEFVNDLSLQTFLSGDVDFYPTVLYINDTYEREGYGKIIYNTLDDAKYNSIAVGYSSDEFINENPEAVKAVYNALQKAVEYVKENTEEYYQLLSDASSGTFKPESFAAENVNNTDFADYSPEVTEDNVKWLNELKEYALRNELIVEDFDIDSWIYHVE